MATTIDPTSVYGSGIRRREDPRFLTGRGRYTDDIKLPDMTHAVFVRSPHAHARIRSIDTSAARRHPGVRAVLTGADLKKAGVNPIPVAWLLPGIKMGERRPMAVDRVRYVGEAVAVVIADTPYAACDAAALIAVDYEPLPAVVDASEARRDGAPQLYDDAPNNIVFNFALGDAAATDAAFAGAKTVVSQRLVNQRLTSVAIEPRASVASYEAATDETTLYVTSQNPHVHRLIMGAFVLGIAEHKFRVVAPDVGGGFGSKIHVYPEEVVMVWASKTLGVPVKWTAERSESFMTDSHGRDHVSEAAMAFDEQGRIVGFRVNTVANMGANLSLLAPVVPTFLYATLLSGQYAIPAIHAQVTAVFTNTTPVDAVRGAGRPEACYLVERLVDIGARAMNMDPADVRRRSFVRPDKFPYQTAVALVYDSGNYEPALDKALEMVNYTHLRSEQERLRREGRYLGIGFSTYIEACGVAPSQVVGSLGAQAGLWESATVRVHPTGKITVFTGSHSHGQGHETTFAQLVSHELGVPLDDVDIVHGDTARVPFGMGTYGSRSGAVGASAIHMSLQKVIEKGKKIAAHLLEAAPEDMEFAGGRFHVKGSPDRAKGFGEIALMAYLAHSMPADTEPGLEATSFFDPSNFTFPFGAHIAVVEVDANTGQVKVLRYVAVDDVGNVINPTIVEGQLHGGVAHGIGQALLESVAYDDNGQLLTASLTNYGIPKADMLPSFETARTVTPTPVNPLGIKGAGEAGTIAATPAIANAVVDALAPFGITHIDIPLTAPRVWDAIQRAQGRA